MFKPAEMMNISTTFRKGRTLITLSNSIHMCASHVYANDGFLRLEAKINMVWSMSIKRSESVRSSRNNRVHNMNNGKWKKFPMNERNEQKPKVMKK